MILDVNVLLAYIDTDHHHHQRVTTWLDRTLNGPIRVGFPLHTILGFWRISTHHRVLANPLTPGEAYEQITAWLDAPAAWIPQPGSGHLKIVKNLLDTAGRAATLVPDAHLAALSIEHGVDLVTDDQDFLRFGDFSCIPLTALG